MWNRRRVTSRGPEMRDSEQRVPTLHYLHTEHTFRRWCTSCHAPRLTPDLPPPRALAEDPGESRGVQMIDGGAPTQPEDAPGMKPASAAKTANARALESTMLTEAETLSSTGPTWSRRNPVILAASIPMAPNPSQRQRPLSPLPPHQPSISERS